MRNRILTAIVTSFVAIVSNVRVGLAAAVLATVGFVAAAPGALAAPLADDAPGESNLGYLLAGTLLTWAGFFAYAIYLARKNRDLRREVEELRRLLGERE